MLLLSLSSAGHVPPGAALGAKHPSKRAVPAPQHAAAEAQTSECFTAVIGCIAARPTADLRMSSRNLPSVRQRPSLVDTGDRRESTIRPQECPNHCKFAKKNLVRRGFQRISHDCIPMAAG